MESIGWIQLAVQAGGAIAVCGMFLWYLKELKKAEDLERAQFMAHLEKKDALHNEALSKQMEYLQQRDLMFQDIARSNQATLSNLATEITKLGEQLK